MYDSALLTDYEYHSAVGGTVKEVTGNRTIIDTHNVMNLLHRLPIIIFQPRLLRALSMSSTALIDKYNVMYNQTIRHGQCDRNVIIVNESWRLPHNQGRT